MREISSRGARDLLVVYPLAQRDTSSHDVRPQATAPSAARLEELLGYARDLGLRVGLMPLIQLDERAGGAWRGQVAPPAVDLWFDAYERALWPLVEALARQGGARLVVASELDTLARRAPARWARLIAGARARFQGRLTYSANWDQAARVPFWGQLDEVGVSAYYPLDDREARGDDLRARRPAWRAAWARWREEARALSARVGRPVLFTEAGYPALPSAPLRPWDDAPARHERPEPALQRALYEELCAAWRGEEEWGGLYAWGWFGYGGPLDATFCLRGKPAARALESCFRQLAADERAPRPASPLAAQGAASPLAAQGAASFVTNNK